ncbi:MAG: helix-turn-helix domain-containing protein [Coriobacteriia bacterium]|nr:helix-turn-helix domain-containing protein [Coriobacteriia bacterium]
MKTESTNLEQYAQLLGSRLRAIRLERKLSQETVSQQAGISTFTYRKLEYGESNPGTPANPRLKTLMNLSHVFDIDLKELLP